jgi:hypothetical protein
MSVKGKPTTLIAQRRNNYATQIAVNWLRQNRPDVMELARACALKKFPLDARKPKGRIELPEELANLK